MKPLPTTNETLFVRTDYSDDRAWKDVCAAVRAMDPEMRQALDHFASHYEWADEATAMGGLTQQIVDDSEYQGATTEQLINLASTGSEPQHFLMFIADETTFSQPDHPILVVDLMLEPGRTFRTIPSQLFTIDSNLSIANMDWEDFAERLDDDGVFRGFGE